MDPVPPESSRTSRSPVRSALAARTREIGEARDSPFFVLLQLADQRHDVISLGRGEPDIPTPMHIIEAAKRALDDGFTTYTNPAGLPALRQAIGDKLLRDNDLRYDPGSEILVTSGAQEAIAVVMQTLVNPGDEIVLASPFYNAYRPNIIMAGGISVGVPTRIEDGFQMLASNIEPLITARTKLLVVISPNNPAASVLTRSVLEEIAELAQRKNLVVLSDELYEKIVYDGFEPVSIASLPGMRERTIVVNGFSKTYSMTGFRVGYMAGPQDYISAALEPRHSFSISSPTPFQYAALAALHGPEQFLKDMIDEYTKRRDKMAAAFDALGVRYSLPRGAFYFWADISGSGLDAYTFAKRAVTDHGLLFFPGSMYGEGWDSYIRISFLAQQAELDEALRRFAVFYRELHQDPR